MGNACEAAVRYLHLFVPAEIDTSRAPTYLIRRTFGSLSLLLKAASVFLSAEDILTGTS
jgi:hypothetical protein